MNINQLHKLTGELIERGLGRKIVCIDKSKCSHVLESDGAVIMPVTLAEINNVPMIDDDVGTKVLKSGVEARRTFLIFQAEHGTPSIDRPLQCNIESNQLVIRIGLSTLAFAAEYSDDNPGYKIISSETLAEDIRFELLKEKENGESILTNMLDKATNAAFDNGSVAFDHKLKIESR